MAEKSLKAFGAYVSSLSVSLGWGGQGGSMQMKLVEDPDNGVNIDLPSVGTAVYFKYGGFYFGGILQRWVYNESLSGRIYDIVIESPSKLMDGVQLIIENFNGATDRWVYTDNCDMDEISTNAEGDTLKYNDPVSNVYNIFGYYENPNEGINGAFKNFGASNFNTAGLQVSKILEAITQLSKRDSANVFGGPIIFGTDKGFSEYELDVSELDSLGSSDSFGDYRLKGPVKSVNTLISEMADLFQFDYYYSVQPESIPSEDGGGSISNPLIKLKVLDRSEPPSSGKVQDFVNQKKASGTLISSQVGEEFGDTVTQKIIWGGNRSRYLKLRDVAGAGAPHYVVLGNNLGGAFNIVGTITDIYDQDPINTEFTIYLKGLENERNGNGDKLSTYRTTPFELRMALGGKEGWEIYKTFETLAKVELNGFNNIFDCPWTGAFDNTNDVIRLLSENEAAVNAYDLTMSNVEAAAKGDDEEKNKTLNSLYAAVNNIAQSSYGQQFLIFLPNERPEPEYNYYLPAEEYNYLKTWDVAESAYDSRPVTNDIANFSALGRVTSLAGWKLVEQNYWDKKATSEGNVAITTRDFNPLGSDYAIGVDYDSDSCKYSDLVLSKKGSPEQETFWDFTSGRWAVIFNAGAQIRAYDSITTPAFGLTHLAKIFFDVDIPPEKYISVGKTAMQFAIPPDIAMPRFFGIPQESARFRWGPWVTDPSSFGFSNRGKAQVEEKESLRPETFGGFSNLSEIGALEAEVGKSDMQAVESGYVEVAGAPEYNVGERFATTGPYVSNMDISVDVSGGVKTNYKLTTWTPEFGTMNKYNINRIADIKKRSFEYAKQQRDQITQRPFPAVQGGKAPNFNDLLSKRHNGDFAALVKLFMQSGGTGLDCPPELCGKER